MSDHQFKCSRCSKSYVYKGALTAHIKNKHPLQTQPKMTTGNKPALTKATLPADPVRIVENGNKRKNVWNVIPNLNTTELDNLIEEEEEFFNAVEEFEHDVGINQSMIDWHKVNFESSFGNSGEFSGRLASVVQPNKCNDCEINSKTIDTQRDLLMKQDKQIHEGHQLQRDMKDKLKNYIKNLNETVKELARSTKEADNLKVQLQVKNDTVIALKLRYENDNNKSKVKEPEATNQHEGEEEEGPLKEDNRKCKRCNFQTTNRVLMGEHQDKFHGGYKCLMCSSMFKTKKSSLQHKKVHDEELNVHLTAPYPLNVYSFKCTPCRESFRTSEEMMDHLSKKHLTEEQRRGDGLVKYKKGHDVLEHDTRPPTCSNGDNCRYHRQKRCNFYHASPPKFQKSHAKRLTPSDEWKQVPARWQSNHQGHREQQPHEHQSQGPRSWGAPRDVSTTWCKHADNCLQGRFCVLRQSSVEDVPYRQQQTRGGGGAQSVSSIQIKPCKFGSRCDRGRNCSFLHLPKDFLPLNTGRRN